MSTACLNQQKKKTCTFEPCSKSNNYRVKAHQRELTLSKIIQIDDDV
jgi:hypothetical protein